MATYLVRALSVRRWTGNAADRRYRLITRERGTVDVTVAGAALPKSKLAGHLEPWSEARVMLARGRGPYRVAGALVEHRLSVRDTITARRLAQFTRVAEQLLGGEQPQPEAYDVAVRGASRTCESSGEGQVAALAGAVLRLGYLTGYVGEVSRCSRCGRSLSQGGFVGSFGGVRCGGCRQPGDRGVAGAELSLAEAVAEGRAEAVPALLPIAEAAVAATLSYPVRLS